MSPPCKYTREDPENDRGRHCERDAFTCSKAPLFISLCMVFQFPRILVKSPRRSPSLLQIPPSPLTSNSRFERKFQKRETELREKQSILNQLKTVIIMGCRDREFLNDETYSSSPSSLSEVLIFATMCIIGLPVDVHVKDGSVYSGLFHTSSVEDDYGM